MQQPRSSQNEGNYFPPLLQCVPTSDHDLVTARSTHRQNSCRHHDQGAHSEAPSLRRIKPVSHCACNDCIRLNDVSDASGAQGYRRQTAGAMKRAATVAALISLTTSSTWVVRAGTFVRNRRPAAGTAAPPRTASVQMFSMANAFVDVCRWHRSLRRSRGDVCEGHNLPCGHASGTIAKSIFVDIQGGKQVIMSSRSSHLSLCMKRDAGEGDDSEGVPKHESSNNGGSDSKKSGRRGGTGGVGNNHDASFIGAENNNTSGSEAIVIQLKKRIVQLEKVVASQTVEIRKLKQECKDWGETAAAIAEVLDLLRASGLPTSLSPSSSFEHGRATGTRGRDDTSVTSKRKGETPKRASGGSIVTDGNTTSGEETTYEYVDDQEIFGRAPRSVIEAADAAGASILAAMLAGKRRMLVDVRDAELSGEDPEMLVQFIELAILPVAAGLEGLGSEHPNRVKIVFPTVTQLLEYRKTMALSAPEVVALSVLGFNCVEDKDNLVVFIGPSPDDDQGSTGLVSLLDPPDPSFGIPQPVVVLNHHMLPLTGAIFASFEVVYHLRLLSVQYMTGDGTPEFIESSSAARSRHPEFRDRKKDGDSDTKITDSDRQDPLNPPPMGGRERSIGGKDLDSRSSPSPLEDNDAALEAAMEHAYDSGVHQGVTRAMVIRSYPRPWHVFVDTSPDADADFEVAATFDEEPSQDEVNYAIVECLQGSEREDELVAQQMQAALESGQLDRVAWALGTSDGENGDEKDGKDEGDDDDDDDYDIYFDDFDFDAYDST